MRPGAGTRQKLLDTAGELIWKQSYGAVSVDDICARANVRKGSFYHFFPSKSELAVAACEEQWQRGQELLDRIFSAQRPAWQRIEEYCAFVGDSQRAQLHKSGKVCGCPYGSLGAELSTLDENIRQKSHQVFARNCKYLEAAIRDLVRDGLVPPVTNPAEKAREIHCFVTGVLVEAKIENCLSCLDYLLPGIRRLLEIDAQVPASAPVPA